MQRSTAARVLIESPNSAAGFIINPGLALLAPEYSIVSSKLRLLGKEDYQNFRVFGLVV
jgi:hypothetical protein